MVNKIKYLLFLSALFLSCRHDHKHEVSADLKAAYEIQQNVLSENKTVNEFLDTTSITVPTQLLNRREELLKSMIEIPGMDHDHQNCNHDHKRPTFKITDAEMIEVQKEWRDSLLVINKIIQELQ